MQKNSRHQPPARGSFEYAGVILRRDDHQDAALEQFQRAIKADSGNALYHYNCGNACKDLERFDEAARCYEQAL